MQSEPTYRRIIIIKSVPMLLLLLFYIYIYISVGLLREIQRPFTTGTIQIQARFLTVNRKSIQLLLPYIYSVKV